MASILTTKQVETELSDGDVVWFESYYEGENMIIPYMADFEICGQKPVLVNANDRCLHLDAEDIEKHMLSKWKTEKFRWWDSYPTKTECEKEKRWQK